MQRYNFPTMAGIVIQFLNPGVVNVREHTFTRTCEPLWKYDTAEIFAFSLYQLSRIFECIYIGN